MSGEFVSVQIRGSIAPATVLRKGYFLKLPITTRAGLSVGGVIDVNLRPHTIVDLVAYPAGEPEVWAVAWPDLTAVHHPRQSDEEYGGGGEGIVGASWDH